jgi:hypothetical protein
VIRVHPEGLPAEVEPSVVEALIPVIAADPGPRPLIVSVDRVKKFWGEFF